MSRETAMRSYDVEPYQPHVDLLLTYVSKRLRQTHEYGTMLGVLRREFSPHVSQVQVNSAIRKMIDLGAFRKVADGKFRPVTEYFEAPVKKPPVPLTTPQPSIPQEGSMPTKEERQRSQNHRNQILEFLSEFPGSTSHEIADFLDADRAAIGQTLIRMAGSGLLKSQVGTGKGIRGRYYLYSLAEEKTQVTPPEPNQVTPSSVPKATQDKELVYIVEIRVPALHGVDMESFLAALRERAGVTVKDVELV